LIIGGSGAGSKPEPQHSPIDCCLPDRRRLEELRQPPA
jgi:hypothetical protein